MPEANADALARVAPELREALELFPKIDFSMGLEPFRQPIFADAMPPMPPAQQSVKCEERTLPGPAGAPDVRVLIYTPPGLGSGPHPALLNIHGGGYIIGMPEQ